MCPWFACPACDDKNVNSELVWRFSDIRNRIEKLTCSSEQCNPALVMKNSCLQELACNRNGIPDILFTTTESLNTRISDLWSRHIFEWVLKRPNPRFLLLDEIHTFEGSSGAQNALTLRRWRKAIGEVNQLHWVGLSATLDRPEEFFATLTNLDLASIANFKPEYSLGEIENVVHIINFCFEITQLFALLLFPQLYKPQCFCRGCWILPMWIFLQVVWEKTIRIHR